MSTAKTIDINSWRRKEHYEFFKNYEEPFFGITTNIDCTKAYKKAKETNVSFFLYYMHKSLLAVNAVEELRYRIENNAPVVYDVIHGSTTVQNANQLFAFVFLPFSADFETFYKNAKESVEKGKRLQGLGLDENAARHDVIHYSTIPWVSFTSVTHERCFTNGDSVPKITFGKLFECNGKLLLPVAFNAHHGLVDGLHAGKYFEKFQEFLDS